MIKFYKPTIKRAEMKAVLESMVDESIGIGNKGVEFSNLLSEFLSIKYSRCYRSYQDAIYQAFKALDLDDNSCLLISSLTDSIYLDILNQLNIKYIIKDISFTDGLIPLDEVRLAIEEDNITHYLIFSPYSQTTQSLDIYKELGLTIIEDISHSLGSKINERKYSADITIARFEDYDIITSGGGSALLTNDEELFNKINETKYSKMTDLNASLAIVQLKELSSLIEKRNSLYRLYLSSTMKTGVNVFGQKSIDFMSNGYAFIVIVDAKVDTSLSICKKYDIEAKVFDYDIVLKEVDFDNYPNTSVLMTRGILIPLYPHLSTKDTQTIVKIIAHIK